MKARRSRLYDNLFFFVLHPLAPCPNLPVCCTSRSCLFLLADILNSSTFFLFISLCLLFVCSLFFFHLLTFSHPVVDTAEIRSNPLLNVVSLSTLCTARTRITAAKKTLWLSPYQRDTHLRQRRRWYPEEEGGQEEQYYHLLRRQEQQRRPWQQQQSIWMLCRSVSRARLQTARKSMRRIHLSMSTNANASWVYTATTIR